MRYIGQIISENKLKDVGPLLKGFDFNDDNTI